jgi:imidazolonepropionase-like amidohydrolase
MISARLSSKKDHRPWPVPGLCSGPGLSGALFLFGTITLLSSCSKPHKPVLAITHVTVIDATGSAPQPDMTLLITDQRIAAIAPSKSINIPRSAQIVDATGKFLIPSLFDMHLHLTGAGEPGGSREFFIPLLLANGITTVRDMGGDLKSLIPLRKEIEQGKRLGPQIFFSGPYLDGSPPSFQPSIVVTNAVEASEDVHSLIQRGVDFIKVQSILSRDAYFAIANVCRREHITFVGHVPDRVTAAEAADAGQKSIEHLTGVLRACSNDEPRLMREQFFSTPKKETPAQSHARQLAWQRELLRTYSDKKAAALIDKFIRNQTWQVPTLILLKKDAFPTPDSDPSQDVRRKYVPRRFLEGWEKGAQARDKGTTHAEFELRKALLAKSIQFAGKMQAAGVHLMAGTDSAAPYVFPGSSLHDELGLLVQAGLSPMQALQAATKNPAEFLGKLQTQGTIEQDKFADLLLLDANPLAGIHNTQKIRAVVLRGKIFDRNTLDELLALEEKFAAAN